MTLFRVLNPLTYHNQIIPKGLHDLQLNDQQVQALQRVGAIAPIHAPPLEALPGWEARLLPLQEAGIVTLLQFLEADTERLATVLNESCATIASWKQDSFRWLEVRS